MRGFGTRTVGRDEPDAVHQARVSLRRMRSILRCISSSVASSGVLLIPSVSRGSNGQDGSPGPVRTWVVDGAEVRLVS